MDTAPETATVDATRDNLSRQTATVDSAAQLLGVSVRTVQRRIKAGELSAIEQSGRRVVLLPDTTTKGATVDATPRHFVATARDIGGELVEQLRSENFFLRSLLEQRDRDAAEIRAALRKALELAPKAIEAPKGTDGPKTHGAAVVSPMAQNGVQRVTNARETGAASYGDIADELEF